MSALTEEEASLLEEEAVSDDSEKDDAVPIGRYDITSFGADYDVEGLVKRLNRGDVFIPSFQREYVWTQKEASRFVESLLLGLPVPGVFMAREPDTNKLLVIDGQQRLKSLQFFYGGFFNPHNSEKSQRVFTLSKVQPKFEGRSYSTLDEQDRIKLNDAIIHATVVKQESPEGDDTSIYYIFERLNYGGRRLTPQEIRLAIYHGELIDTVAELNEYPSWRKIYGKQSPRLKDRELILRFLAFSVDAEKYKRPMAEFLNKFTARNRHANIELLTTWKAAFREAIDVFAEAVGRKAFRPGSTINAAVFDSMMVGLSRRLARGTLVDTDAVRTAYETLVVDRHYEEVTTRSTADEKFVGRRLSLAETAFADVP